jgi:hypothetical protein
VTAAAKKAAAKKAAAAPSPEPVVDEPVVDEPKAAKKKGGPSYTVVAPLIAVAFGSQVLQYSAGDVLPNGIAAETIERLTDRGFIAESE